MKFMMIVKSAERSVSLHPRINGCHLETRSHKNGSMLAAVDSAQPRLAPVSAFRRQVTVTDDFHTRPRKCRRLRAVRVKSKEEAVQSPCASWSFTSNTGPAGRRDRSSPDGGPEDFAPKHT